MTYNAAQLFILPSQLLVEDYLKVNTWKFTQTHKHLCLVAWGRGGAGLINEMSLT